MTTFYYDTEMQLCEKIACIKTTDCTEMPGGVVCLCRWKKVTEFCKIAGLSDADKGECCMSMAQVMVNVASLCGGNKVSVASPYDGKVSIVGLIVTQKGKCHRRRK